MWCTDEAPTRCAPRDGFGSPVSSLRQRLYGRPDAESRLGLAAELDGGLELATVPYLELDARPADGWPFD